MPRINPVNPEQASGKAKELLDGVQKKFGGVPNVLATMANAPSVLEAYLGLGGALAGGSFSPGEREQIAIAVAAANSCNYCLAAHTEIGKGAGVSDADLDGAQTGEVSDGRASAAVSLAGAIVETRGFIADADLERARAAGLSDGEILEVTAIVIQNFLTNYVNHIAETEIDFPAVENRVQTVS